MKKPFFFSTILSLLINTCYAGCTITTSNLSFGTYDTQLAQDNISSTRILVNCSPVVPYDVLLGGGNSGTYLDRYLKGLDFNNSNEKLHYNLYKNGLKTLIFGDDPSTGSTYTGITASAFYIYARIPKTQKVAPGLYSDNPLIQINF